MNGAYNCSNEYINALTENLECNVYFTDNDMIFFYVNHDFGLNTILNFEMTLEG